MKQAYIVKAYRTAVGKAPKGVFRFKRADELGSETIKYMMNELPELDVNRIDDVIVGNAMPEGSQGLNMARFISLIGLNSVDVPGVTINRFCSSGLETIGLAVAKIRSGMADCIIAGGSESMSSVPMTGYKPELNYDTINSGHVDYYWGMGNTAEAVANEFNISRSDQDKFAYNSHLKALKAQSEDRFKDEIVPITVNQTYIDEYDKKVTKKYTVFKDEGPRKNTNIEALSGLRAVFANGGSVTAGNSSQMSDGAAFVMIMSEKLIKELKLKPIARLVSYSVAGVEPRIMGIGPVMASNKALAKAGLTMADMDIIELNEAFSAQALACIREWGLKDDDERINPNGGAIAIGHPLGASGTRIIQTAAIELQKQNKKFALITMCIGVGQGYATIIERV